MLKKIIYATIFMQDFVAAYMINSGAYTIAQKMCMDGQRESRSHTVPCVGMADERKAIESL